MTVKIISGIFVNVHDGLSTFANIDCILCQNTFFLSHHLPLQNQIPFDQCRYYQFNQAYSLSCFDHFSYSSLT